MIENLQQAIIELVTETTNFEILDLVHKLLLSESR
jgi:hypothetical protein